MDLALRLIDSLQLAPHPEGGHYREIFRSEASVAPQDGRGSRTAVTTIYFLLRSGEQSALHRVRSDEIWHFYEGAPLELLWVPPSLDRVERVRLGPLAQGGSLAQGAERVAVVPAGCWQAARPLGSYALVGCSVGPGFEFADFEMLRDLPQESGEVTGKLPELRAFM